MQVDSVYNHKNYLDRISLPRLIYVLISRFGSLVNQTPALYVLRYLLVTYNASSAAESWSLVHETIDLALSDRYMAIQLSGGSG